MTWNLDRKLSEEIEILILLLFSHTNCRNIGIMQVGKWNQGKDILQVRQWNKVGTKEKEF
jgi:hypothetical protein